MTNFDKNAKIYFSLKHDFYVTTNGSRRHRYFQEERTFAQAIAAMTEKCHHFNRLLETIKHQESMQNIYES